MRNGTYFFYKFRIVDSFCRMLNLGDNKFKAFQAIEFFAAIPSTIEKLDLSGRLNAEINLKNLSKSVVQ